MAPKENVDYVLEHELKEAGVHIMICTASYFEPTGEERKVRQYFKFQVRCRGKGLVRGGGGVVLDSAPINLDGTATETPES